MQDDRPNIIVEKTLEFALLIVEFSELLESNRKFVIANQIIKSGTSIGANKYCCCYATFQKHILLAKSYKKRSQKLLKFCQKLFHHQKNNSH